jgi:DNA-binding protein H-NS
MSNKTIELIREELAKKSIPLNELIELKEEIDKGIEILQNELIKELCEKAIANGIPLEKFGDKVIQSIKSEHIKNPPKYKNPNNINQTWSGHGKNPNWVKEWIASGKSLDDLKI